ncbi:F-box domain-containing protein [Heracleum sosnowskyi]|uniref:F-box domain-containing protein n=1 Tax=Heracleum sosnowskyi TaxID=360622 RepID=A0AAD8GV90_9APIA|nr:F-box domain-containing protein [Heracleum sosnowskyi]
MALPYDLIYEILCRVPVKYLLRCRCVSKGLCYLIDSSEFMNKHLKTSIECNNGGIIIQRDGNFYLADYESLHDDVTNAIEIDDSVKSLLSGAKLVGSANDLVCFANGNNNVIALLNPSTWQCKTLPKPPAKLQRYFGKYTRVVWGFGYDHLSDDYKVVKTKRYFMCDDIMVIEYSLKTNSWKPIQNVRFSRGIFLLQHQWGMFANGALYWQARYYKEKKFCSVIVGFDLGVEQFREVTENLLSLDNLHIPNNYSVNLLQMNEYSAENPWSKAFSVLHNVIGCSNVFRPLAYSESRQEVLMLESNTNLVWHNLESNAIKNVSINGIPKDELIYAHSYTVSLFRFTEDRPLQKPSHETKGKKQPLKKKK